MNLFILLAEDNEFHAAALEAALRRMGHSVHRTGSRAEALDRLYYHAYDLVITDLRMPGVTSLEGWVADIRGYHRGRLIICSGVVEPLGEIARQFGALLLPKPYTLAQLQSALEG